ncbi:MAG: TRAP transporter small permease [Deltaproteobacteria bacterium]|nr:TRAP transporter small permease [Deltaproteobacteria bacterium]
MNKIAAIIKRCNFYCYCTSYFLLIFVALITFFDVIGRYFRHPIPGTFELSQFALSCMIFLSIAHTLAIKGHIFLDFAIPLPHKVQSVLDILLSLVSLFVMVIFTWKSVPFILDSYMSKEWSDYLHIPLFFVKISLFIGGLGFSLQLIIDIIEKFKQPERMGSGFIVD